jgi:four helix bundle protein
MQDFRKLRVWHQSVDLAASIYSITSDFPRTERFGITSQMRSAALSISSNIAEGSGRDGPKDMARFLQMAIGSTSELESQLLVANRLGLVGATGELLDDVDKLRRQLIRLRDHVHGS